LFLDPDNGFQPKKTYSKKHVLFSDVEAILDQIPDESVISVFQYFRRIRFVEDYANIKTRILSEYSTAIYWHSLMFVQISRSQKLIERVKRANASYVDSKPSNCVHLIP